MILVPSTYTSIIKSPSSDSLVFVLRRDEADPCSKIFHHGRLRSHEAAAVDADQPRPWALLRCARAKSPVSSSSACR